MPCPDKKLEASRPDFYLNKAETREVDCVLTSGTVSTPLMFFVCMNVQHLLSFHFVSLFQIGEVLKMLEEEKVSLSDVQPAPLDTM